MASIWTSRRLRSVWTNAALPKLCQATMTLESSGMRKQKTLPWLA
jgi:hypothetical protein